MKTIPVVNPANEEVITEIPDQGPEEVHKAASKASQAFDSWRKVPAHEKAELLHEIARRIRGAAPDLARILTEEGGKPFRENKDEMGWSASCFDYYAEIARSSRGRVIPSIEPSQLALVVHEPYGVVGCIVPWNYPILLMAWKLAPALAAGNTVVLKPAEQTPLATLEFRKIFDCLPSGVVEIVTGTGEVTGDAIVRHPDIPLIAFTGSLETGKRVAGICAEMIEKGPPRAWGQGRFRRLRGLGFGHRGQGGRLGVLS